MDDDIWSIIVVGTLQSYQTVVVFSIFEFVFWPLPDLSGLFLRFQFLVLTRGQLCLGFIFDPLLLEPLLGNITGFHASICLE